MTVSSGQVRARYRQIVGTFARHGFGLLSARRGTRLRAALEELGPVFVKLGQFLATRPDLLPPDVASALATLHDRVASGAILGGGGAGCGRVGCTPGNPVRRL